MRLKNVKYKTVNVSNLLPLPARLLHGHKGTFGRVLVIGGSEGMVGAPVFAGTAALRMGAGLVQIAVPKNILSAALTITPELIGIGLPSRPQHLADALDKANAVVVGPGLGHGTGIRAIVRKVLKSENKIVLDADGLNVIANFKVWPKHFLAEAILTPHPGEMARLLNRKEIPSDREGRCAIAVEYAKRFRQIVVLKGFNTIVTDGASVYVNLTGDTSLSKAGTGDVLSGMIAALLAQNMKRFEAACLAVHLHGLAGEIAGGKLGVRSVLATDVINAISDAIRDKG